MKDYEKWVAENNINDPKDQQAILDYVGELFSIATDVVMKETLKADEKTDA